MVGYCKHSNPGTYITHTTRLTVLIAVVWILVIVVPVQGFN
jgi:hypothetical protein